MPRFVTQKLKTTELYFDLRIKGAGTEAEGFWAYPLFASDERAKMQELQAKGRENQVWVEMLCKNIIRWEGFSDMAGADIPCTPENIRELCDSDFYTMWAIYNTMKDAANMGTVVAEKN